MLVKKGLNHPNFFFCRNYLLLQTLITSMKVGAEFSVSVFASTFWKWMAWLNGLGECSIINR